MKTKTLEELASTRSALQKALELKVSDFFTSLVEFFNNIKKDKPDETVERNEGIAFTFFDNLIKDNTILELFKVIYKNHQDGYDEETFTADFRKTIGEYTRAIFSKQDPVTICVSDTAIIKKYKELARKNIPKVVNYGTS